MSRPQEPPLVDPVHHSRRSVSLTVAADYLGVSVDTVRRRIEEGLLPARRDGKVYRISVSALLRYEAAARARAV